MSDSLDDLFSKLPDAKPASSGPDLDSLFAKLPDAKPSAPAYSGPIVSAPGYSKVQPKAVNVHGPSITSPLPSETSVDTGDGRTLVQSQRSPTGYLQRLGPKNWVPATFTPAAKGGSLSFNASADALPQTPDILRPFARGVEGLGHAVPKDWVDDGSGASPLTVLGQHVNEKLGQAQDFFVTHPFGVYSPQLDRLNKGPLGQVVGGVRDAALGAINPIGAAGFGMDTVSHPAATVDQLVTMVAKAEGVAPSDGLRDRISSIVGSGMLAFGLAHGLGQAKGALSGTLQAMKDRANAPVGATDTPFSAMSDADLSQHIESHQANLDKGVGNADQSRAAIAGARAELGGRAAVASPESAVDALFAKLPDAEAVKTPTGKTSPVPDLETVFADIPNAETPTTPPDIAPRPNPVTPEGTTAEATPHDPASLVPAWQRTRAEFVGNAHPDVTPLMQDVHEASVRTALAEGHDVPLNVLQNYPNLAAKRGVQVGTEALRALAPDDPRLSLDDPFGESHDPDLVKATYKAHFGELPPLDEHGMPTEAARSQLRTELERARAAAEPRDMDLEKHALPDIQKLGDSKATEPFWRVFKMKNGEKAVDARNPTKFVSLEGLPRHIQQAILDEANSRSGERSYLSDKQYRNWVGARKPTIRGALDLSEVSIQDASDENYVHRTGATSTESGLDRAVVPKSIVKEFAKNLKEAIAHNDALEKAQGKYPTDAEIEAAKNRALAPDVTQPGKTVGVYNARQAADVAAGEYAEPEKGNIPNAQQIHEMGKDITSLEDAEALGKRVKARAEGADSTPANFSRGKEGARLFKIAVDNARDAEFKAINDGSPDVAHLRDVRTALEARRQQFLDDLQKGKGEWASGGHALQQETALDTGSYADMSRDLTIKQGRPLTLDEQNSVKAATDEVRRLNEVVANLEEKAKQSVAQDRAEGIGRKRAVLTVDEKVATKARIKDNAAKLAKLVLVPEHVGAGPADFFQKFPEARAIIRDIAQDVVKLGASTVNEMIAGVKQALIDQGIKDHPSDREIRDAFSGYGAEHEPKTLGEAQARLAEVKTLSKIQSQIEDVVSGESAAKVQGRKSASQMIEDARKMLADVRKTQKARRAVPNDPAVAMERRLTKLLDTLENGPKETAAKAPMTSRMVDVQARITKAIADIRAKYGESVETKRVTELQKQLAEARKVQAEGKTPAAETEGPPTAQVDALEKELADLNEKNFQTRASESEKSAVNDVRKKITALETKIATEGQEKPGRVVREGPDTAELADLKRQEADLTDTVRRNRANPTEDARAADLQKKIQAAKDKLANGPEPKTPKAEGPPTARIAGLEQQLKEANRAIAAKYNGDPIAARLGKLADSYDKLEREYRTNTRAAAVDKGFEPSVIEDAKKQLDDMRKLHNVQDQTNELDRRIREKDFSKASKRTEDTFKELEDARKARDKKRAQLLNEIEASKPTTFSGHVKGFVRGNVLSGLGTLMNLGTAVAGHVVTAPLEEAVGPLVRHTVGRIGGLADMAGTETRFSPKAEAAAAGQILHRQTLADAWSKLVSGEGSISHQAIAQGLEFAHGQPKNPFLRFVQNSHSAIKTVTERNAFTREWVKGLEDAQRKGLDTQDPNVRAGLFEQAYKKSKIGLLQNDSIAADWLSGIIKSAPNEVFKGVAHALLPVVKVPVNLAGRVGEFTAGIPYAAFRQAIETYHGTMTPESAQAIVRAYKRGAVGLGLYLYARSAKSPFDVDDKGELTLGGATVPKSLNHVPALEAIKLGAYDKKFGGGLSGAVKGAAMTGVDVGLRTPALGAPREIVDTIGGTFAATPEKRVQALGRGLGSLTRSVAEPQLMQQIARARDTSPPPKNSLDVAVNMTGLGSKTVPRKTQTYGDEMASGVPILREGLGLGGVKATQPGQTFQEYMRTLGKDDAAKYLELFKQGVPVPFRDKIPGSTDAEKASEIARLLNMKETGSVMGAMRNKYDRQSGKALTPQQRVDAIQKAMAARDKAVAK